MARQYGRIKTSIWNDDDFRQLNDAAQSLYQRLLSSPSMNLCGVCDWRPKRMAMLTKGMTATKVEAAGADLVAGRYIILDEDSDEVLVRTFIKHESVIANPKTAAGMASAFGRVTSMALRGSVADELRRLRVSEPDLKGWGLVTDCLSFTYQRPQDQVSDCLSDRVFDQVPIPLKPEALNLKPGSRRQESEISSDLTTSRPEVQALCVLLADLIEANGSRRPEITAKWLTDCRLMIDKDRRTQTEIEAAIRWSQQSTFWRANILSIGKLREKYDQLRLQAVREAATPRARTTDIDWDAAAARAAERDRDAS